jgi:hypothetical protein
MPSRAVPRFLWRLCRPHVLSGSYAVAAQVKARLHGPGRRAAEQVQFTGRLVQGLAEDVERTGSGFLVVVLPDLSLAATPAIAAARSGVPNVLDLTPRVRAARRAGPPLFYRLDGAHLARWAHAIAEVMPGRRLLPPVLRTCPCPP